jgi:hypothetical protein
MQRLEQSAQLAEEQMGFFQMFVIEKKKAQTFSEKAIRYENVLDLGLVSSASGLFFRYYYFFFCHRVM